MQNGVYISVHTSGKGSKLFSFACSYAVQMSPTEIQERICFHPAMYITFFLARKLVLMLGLGLTFTPGKMFMDIVGALV